MVSGLNLFSTLPLTNSSGIKVIEEAFHLAVRDFLNAVPYVLGALAILSLYVVVAVIVSVLTKKLLSAIKFDEALRPLLGEVYFSLTNLTVALIDVGIALLAVYSIVVVFFPSKITPITVVIEYGARVASVIFLIIFLFLMFNAIIYRIRMETKMKGFIFLLSFFTTTVLILDITALSSEVKNALAWGFSIGIGLSMGVFAAWFFFHDLLEKKMESSG